MFKIAFRSDTEVSEETVPANKYRVDGEWLVFFGHSRIDDTVVLAVRAHDVRRFEWVEMQNA